MTNYQVGSLQQKVQRIGRGLIKLEQQISFLTQQLKPNDISSYGRYVVSQASSEHSILIQSLVLKQKSIQQIDLTKKQSYETTLNTSKDRNISEYVSFTNHYNHFSKTNPSLKKTESRIPQNLFLNNKYKLHSPRPSNPKRNNIFAKYRSPAKKYSPTPTTPTTSTSCDSLQKVSLIRVVPYKQTLRKISPFKAIIYKQQNQIKNKNKTVIEYYQTHY